MAKGDLSPQQRAFADAYLGPAHLVAAEAARQAGYADPGGAGYDCLRLPKVRAYIDARLEAASLTGQEVLAELTAIARAPWQNFIQQRTDYRGEVIDARLDLGDKVKALELLGKAHQLFTDRLRLGGDDGAPIRVLEVVPPHAAEPLPEDA